MAGFGLFLAGIRPTCSSVSTALFLYLFTNPFLCFIAKIIFGIIITDEGKAYILDWSHATIGNASADVARTYLLFWLSGDIAGAGEYLDLFCKKSGTAKQYVQKWMPIVAASQSVKGKPAEREFLLSWVNVVDYQ